MRARGILIVAGVAALAASCATETSKVRPGSNAPGAEACPETFDECVELCAPLGVRHFGCWSPVRGVPFDCQCLDGSRPLEDDGSPDVTGGANLPDSAGPDASGPRAPAPIRTPVP